MGILDLFKPRMVTANSALPGRESYGFAIPERHEVLATPIQPPFPEGLETAYFGLGCFWGAERILWQTPGVYTTAVGYQGGFTPYPTYKETCTGETGHTEAVMVVFDPNVITYEALLKRFWESHDPTQGMRQGYDTGTQYRSAIYTVNDTQHEQAEATRAAYQQSLSEAGHGSITTEIAPAGPFYYAEEYHQQYLEKNPGGYCGIGGTGVTCQVGLGAANR